MKPNKSNSQNADPQVIAAEQDGDPAGEPVTANHSLLREMRLKDLPEPERQLVTGWLKNAGEKECLHRIQVGMGIEVSRATLYRALEEWKNEARLENCEATARHRVEVESILASKELTVEEMEDEMDRQFLKLAVEEKDLKNYVQICRLQIARQSARDRRRIAEAKLELQRQRLALEREKFEIKNSEKLLELAKEVRAQEIASQELSQEEKIALVRKAFFADVDALELELPPYDDAPGMTTGSSGANQPATGGPQGESGGDPQPDKGNGGVNLQPVSSHGGMTEVFPSALVDLPPKPKSPGSESQHSLVSHFPHHESREL